MKVARICALFLFLFLTVSAFAVDIIYMKDGTKRKGKIVGETETAYILENFGARITIPKSKVLKVERGVKTPREIYREKYKKIDKKDPLDLLDLADWCKDHGLNREARRLYKRVLRIEPDNEEAHQALGHVQYKGKWVTREELKKLKARERAAEEEKTGGEEGSGSAGAAGSGDDKEGIKGAAEAAKEMIRAHQAEAKALAKEMIDEIGLDKVACAISDHYILAGEVPQKQIVSLTVLCETVYWDLQRRFSHNKEYDLYKAAHRKHIMFFFSNRSDYSDAFDFAAKKWNPGLARAKGLAMSSAGGFGTCPGFLFSIQRQLSHLPSKVANEAAHHWISMHTLPRTKEAQDNMRFSPWMKEGIGTWAALHFTGGNFTVRVTQTHYANAVEIAKKRGDAGYKLLVKEWAQGKAKSYDHNLRTMMMQKLNRLNFMDLAIAYAVFDYTIRERQDQLKNFLILIRSIPYEEAWQKAFGESLVPQFQETFKRWILKNY